MNQKINELSLLLLYLTSWNEDGYEYDENDNLERTTLKRSWKNYPFESLDFLENQNFIISNHKNKSITLTKEGEKRAIELYERYFGEKDED